MAFTDSGDLLTLVPRSDNMLRLFSEEGHFIQYINDKYIDAPKHLSLANDGRIIITDNKGNKIKVLSPDGNDLLQSFSAPDCDESPDCAIYHQDKIFVSYFDASCVKVFDTTGVCLHDIGCKGSNYCKLFDPRGLVIDKYNRLIVCNTGNQNLQLFALDGKFLSTIDGKYFENVVPFSVAVDNDDSLFVANLHQHCVYVFH